MKVRVRLLERIRRYGATLVSSTNSAALIIKASTIDKAGSFARHDMKKGDLIRKLTGDIVTQREIFRRIKYGKLSPDDPLQIDVDRFIDLDAESLAINHSCNPNSGVRDCNQLVALRDISSGEEVTFDYSTTVTTTIEPFSWSMSCCCGAYNCRRRIGNASTVPEHSLLSLFELNALPRYIAEELDLNSVASARSSQSTHR